MQETVFEEIVWVTAHCCFVSGVLPNNRSWRKTIYIYTRVCVCVCLYCEFVPLFFLSPYTFNLRNLKC